MAYDKEKKRPRVKRFSDFYEAWQFLEHHPMLDYEGSSMLYQCLEIEVVKVDPQTKKIEDHEKRNTETRVWLECGPYEGPEELTEVERKLSPYGTPTSDLDLACGGATFEEAIITLANLVIKKYGRRRKPDPARKRLKN